MARHQAENCGESPDPKRTMGGHDDPLMGWFTGLKNDVTSNLVDDHVIPCAAKVLGKVIAVEISW